MLLFFSFPPSPSREGAFLSHTKGLRHQRQRVIAEQREVPFTDSTASHDVFTTKKAREIAADGHVPACVYMYTTVSYLKRKEGTDI
jgi:hypothetical protein